MSAPNHGLGVLAFNETWIQENTSDADEFCLAPTDFTINHIQRPSGRPPRGGRLAYTAAYDILVSSHTIER